MDSSDSSLPSPLPKSTPATLRRCSQSRRPRRQSPLLAAHRCCAALLLRPTPQSPPTRLHRRRLVSIAIALDCLWRSSYSRGRRRLVSGLKGRKSFFLKSSSKWLEKFPVIFTVKFRPGRGSASAWDKISFVVMPPLLQSAQLKPDVTITSADSDNEIDESDHCSVNYVFLLSLELEFICIGAMCEIDLCVVPMSNPLLVVYFQIYGPLMDEAQVRSIVDEIKQVILLLLALVAVPWMLFPKPFILKRLHTESIKFQTCRKKLVSEQQEYSMFMESEIEDGRPILGYDFLTMSILLLFHVFPFHGRSVFYMYLSSLLCQVISKDESMKTSKSADDIQICFYDKIDDSHLSGI
nr:Karyopherin (importin) beta 3 [Ipomoea batatas]